MAISLFPLACLAWTAAGVAAEPVAEDTAERLAETVASFTQGGRLIVLVISAAVVLAVVALHYEALRLLAKLTPTLEKLPRISITLLIVGLLVVHLLEIAIFGVVFAVADDRGLGSIAAPVGPIVQDMFDYIYFSAVAYTTVGYGDLVPTGPIRLLAAAESLTGLLLIAWSASFTYLQMHRHWSDLFENGNSKKRA